MSTYTQLQADITDILASDDINTSLCVRLAEDELDKVIRLQSQITKTAISVSLTGDRYIGTLPTDNLEAFHIEQAGLRLEYRAPNVYWHEFDKIYTIMGGDIHVTGSDDVDYYYYQKPTALAAGNQTNTYTDECYTTLLYLCLAHAAFYMNDIAKSQNYRAQALETGATTVQADRNMRVSGSVLVQR